jgi:hypothetical protein
MSAGWGGTSVMKILGIPLDAGRSRPVRSSGGSGWHGSFLNHVHRLERRQSEGLQQEKS